MHGSKQWLAILALLSYLGLFCFWMYDFESSPFYLEWEGMGDFWRSRCGTPLLLIPSSPIIWVLVGRQRRPASPSPYDIGEGISAVIQHFSFPEEEIFCPQLERYGGVVSGRLKYTRNCKAMSGQKKKKRIIWCMRMVFPWGTAWSYSLNLHPMMPALRKTQPPCALLFCFSSAKLHLVPFCIFSESKAESLCKYNVEGP